MRLMYAVVNSRAPPPAPRLARPGGSFYATQVLTSLSSSRRRRRRAGDPRACSAPASTGPRNTPPLRQTARPQRRSGDDGNDGARRRTDGGGNDGARRKTDGDGNAGSARNRDGRNADVTRSAGP